MASSADFRIISSKKRILSRKGWDAMEEQVYDMVILGGGPGGYTAALYAARAGLRVVVLEKLAPGGQMALTSQIGNYPGFPEGADGYLLAEKMQEQAHRFGAKTRYAEALAVDLRADPKRVETGEGPVFGRTLVIATGANPRKLGLPMEQVLTGRGVAYCAACDGPFYRGRTVAVVGGGNSAVEDALLLSRTAKKVFLIHRRDSLRAERVSQEALFAAKNVSFLWDSVVTELLHEESLTGLSVRNLGTGETQKIDCDAVFVSIGRVPATDLVRDQLTLDGGGYIPAGESTRTEIPGVYAVGDVRAKPLRQIVTAASDGAVAAHMAQADLQINN